MKDSIKFRWLFAFVALLCLSAVKANVVFAAPIPLPNVDISVGTAETPEEVNRSLQMLLMMSLLALSPFLILMVTSFTRILITFHFLRSAMGTMQMPPNQILIGLALFLTFFSMGPVLTTINDTALKPYTNGEITQEAAIDLAIEPLRDFMLRQVERKDLDLFSELAQIQPYDDFEEMKEKLPNYVLVPSFILGELTKGFKIGVILYIPFIIIDMVVASVLMAMGMMMLPPAMISLPFKILFFIMVDGWQLVIQGLLLTFN